MALSIPNDQLMAGDIVEFIIRPDTSNQTLIDLALRRIKSDLAAEPWFDYQGSQWRIIDGQQCLSIFLKARRYARGERPLPTQEAGVGIIIAVGLAVLAGIVIGAIVAYKMTNTAAIVRRNDQIVTIATDPNLTADQKAKVLTAIQTGGIGGPGLGGALTATGGGLTMLAVVVFLIWVLGHWGPATGGGQHRARPEYD